MLTGEWALIQLKDVLKEKTLIILFLFFSDLSQVFQPYTFRTRRNSTTIMSRHTLVSIEVSIFSGMDWGKYFQT